MQPTVQPGVIRDDYAGPGGWSCGLRLLGLTDVGIEWDEWACRTRVAAGLPTIRADLSRWSSPAKPWGYIASPPCQTFSAAGKRAGRSAVAELVAAVTDAGAGRRGFARHMRNVAGAIRDDLLRTIPKATRAERSTIAWEQARNAVHVVRPMQVIHEHRPEWICMEQVPAVLPIWEAYARALRLLGYSVWCGTLNAADYGVPQTRKRAMLIASRTRTVTAPAPTHARDPQPSLFGELLPWISMAAALGWNGHLDTRRAYQQRPTESGNQEVGTDEPAPTFTAKSGGQWHVHRVGFPRLDDRGDSPDGYRERDWHDPDEPAPAVTEKARSWIAEGEVQLNPGKTSSQPNRRTYDAATEPAPTLAFGHDAASWCWENPAPTITAGGTDSGGGVEVFGNADTRRKIEDSWAASHPAPTVMGGRGGAVFGGKRIREKVGESMRTVPEDRWVRGEADDPEWPASRPATTLAGDPRVPQPGHKNNTTSPDSPGRMQGAIRLEIPEALVLQSFPIDHPVQGPRTAQFRQVGDAVPPLLAAHCVAAATGWPLPPLD